MLWETKSSEPVQDVGKQTFSRLLDEGRDWEDDDFEDLDEDDDDDDEDDWDDEEEF